jgi:ABC-type transporter Mla MlaB component
MVELASRLSTGMAMVVRIRKTCEADQTVLWVDGYLTVEDVDELDREYRSAQGSIVLELSNLLSADSAGMKCLRELISLGAEIRGTSQYIDLLLENEP